MFAALLDTSVLRSSLQRHFLLSLAIEGLYRPLWSTEILAELEYRDTQKLINREEQPDAAAARARHLISQMTTAFDDALLENWEPHEGIFHLRDPNDEHVAAAALVGGAGADNLRDFPIANIPAHIQGLSPAEFAAAAVAISPDVAPRAVQTTASRYSAPPLTTEEILSRLVQRYHMIERSSTSAPSPDASQRRLPDPRLTVCALDSGLDVIGLHRPDSFARVTLDGLSKNHAMTLNHSATTRRTSPARTPPWWTQPSSNARWPMPPEPAPIQLALCNRRTTTCQDCAVPSVSGRRQVCGCASRPRARRRRMRTRSPG
jgi:PIN domain